MTQTLKERLRFAEHKQRFCQCVIETPSMYPEGQFGNTICGRCARIKHEITKDERYNLLEKAMPEMFNSAAMFEQLEQKKTAKQKNKGWFDGDKESESDD